MCVQPRVVWLPIVNLYRLGAWHKHLPFQQYINKKSVRELKKVYAPTDSLKSKVHYHTSLLSVDIHFVQGQCKYLVHCPSHLLQYSTSANITTNFHGTIYNDAGEYKVEGAPWTVIGHLIEVDLTEGYLQFSTLYWTESFWVLDWRQGIWGPHITYYSYHIITFMDQMTDQWSLDMIRRLECLSLSTKALHLVLWWKSGITLHWFMELMHFVFEDVPVKYFTKRIASPMSLLLTDLSLKCNI